MAAQNRLALIERRLTPAQLSRLWLKRALHFAGPAEYVSWFFDEPASSAARRAFVKQAGAVMRRRDWERARALPQSGGSEGRIADLREICSPWFDFWIDNEPDRICLIAGFLSLPLSAWCMFMERWSAAANANLDQANAWLKQPEVRSAFRDSLLRQEGNGVQSPPIVYHLADAGVGGSENESWPHRPPWIDTIPAQFAQLAEKSAEFLQQHASFLHNRRKSMGERPMLFAGLAERFDSMYASCATLVSWFNHAASIGLLPPACAIEPDPTVLSLSARKALKQRFEAERRGLGSGAGDPAASQNTIGEMLFEKEVEREKGSPPEHGRDDQLLFPDVAQGLRVRAQQLQSEIDRLCTLPALEDRRAHNLVRMSFGILEKELIRTHRIPLQAGDTYMDRRYDHFKELRASTLAGIVVSYYRRFVPGGETATNKELEELGTSGIIAAIKKYWDQKNQTTRKRTPKRSASLL